MTTPTDHAHRAVAEQQATPTGKNMLDVVNNIGMVPSTIGQNQ